MKKFIGCFEGDDIYLDDEEDRAAIALIDHLSEECRISVGGARYLDLSIEQAQRFHNYKMSQMVERAAMGEPCFKAEKINIRNSCNHESNGNKTCMKCGLPLY